MITSKCGGKKGHKTVYHVALKMSVSILKITWKKSKKGVDKRGSGCYINKAVRHGGRAAEDNEKKFKKGVDKAADICYDGQAVRESGR